MTRKMTVTLITLFSLISFTCLALTCPQPVRILQNQGPPEPWQWHPLIDRAVVSGEDSFSSVNIATRGPLGSVICFYKARGGQIYSLWWQGAASPAVIPNYPNYWISTSAGYYSCTKSIEDCIFNALIPN